MNASETEPRVFVPHPVLVRTEDGAMRWKFDIERIVRDWGELVPVLADSSIMLTLSVAMRQISIALRGRGFAPERDFFLAAGDMTAFGAMLLVSAHEYGATPRVLRHSRKFDRYDVLAQWSVLTPVDNAQESGT